MSAHNGGPAFPIVTDRGERLENAEGMSLRDYFATKAMEAGMAALLIHSDRYKLPLDWREKAAEGAYMMADAMLKAREA